MNSNNSDLFNNPMVESAKNALTPDQQEEYKEIGKYMYNRDYNIDKVGSKDPTTEQILTYADEGLKAGLDPFELDEKELQALISVYGNEWFEKYGFEKDEVPVPTVRAITKEEALQEVEQRVNKIKKQRNVKSFGRVNNKKKRNK